MYALDRPVSLFPSFHAAVAPILLRLRPASRVLRASLVVWMTAICVSCVLTKQHYVLDVVGGLAVGWGADAVAAMAVHDRELRRKPLASGMTRAGFGAATGPDRARRPAR